MTLVNVFTCAPARQQELIDLLVGATEKTMRRMPGFVSASIHRSLDGKRVINYAQWRSEKDFQAMLGNAEAKPHMAKVAALAEFDPIPCSVVYVDHA